MRNIISTFTCLLLPMSYCFAQWQQYSFLNTDPIQCIAAKGGLIVAGTPKGVFISIDGGGAWSNSSAGLTDSNITAVMISGSNIIAGTATGKIAVKTLLGSTWTEKHADAAFDRVSSFFKTGSSIWAKHNGGMCKTDESTDDGMTWIDKPTITGCFENFVSSGSYLYHGDWTGPVVSTDGGGTWTPANGGYTETSDFSIMGADETGSIVLSRGYWGYANFSTLYHATASASPTWALTSSFYPGHTAATRAFAGFSNILYAGVNDTAIGASHADNGIHTSSDGGLNWYKDGGVVSNGVNCLTIDSVYLYAGGQDGTVWKKLLFTPNATGEIRNAQPCCIFPNPCSGSFQLTLGTHEASSTKVEIYDMAGKMVYNCETSIPILAIDLSNKPKGIYFIRIDDERSVRYSKILLQ